MADQQSGPVKRWADMTDQERAEVRASAKPPGPTPILPSFACGRASTEGEPVEIIGERILRRTEKAIQVLLADTKEPHWFPKSVVEDLDEMDDGTCLLTVKRWFAAKAELING